MQTYLETINPTLNLVYKARLGVISPHLMEKHADRHERLGNLFAPGIGNPKIIHRNVTQPAFIVAHDDFHFYMLASQGSNLSKQMEQTKKLLRQFYPKERGFTAEIVRSIERQTRHTLLEGPRFLLLMHNMFYVRPAVDRAYWSQASVVLLIDMVLHPENWPSYVANKTGTLSILLNPEIDPLTVVKAKVDPSMIKKVEAAVKQYHAIAKENYRFIAALLFCHLFLEDEKLCQGLISSYPSEEIDILWQKNDASRQKVTLVDFKKAQKKYLLKHISQIIIEPVLGELTKYFCTFPKNKRPKLEMIISQWSSIEKEEATTKIQTVYREARKFSLFGVKKALPTQADENELILNQMVV